MFILFRPLRLKPSLRNQKNRQRRPKRLLHHLPNQRRRMEPRKDAEDHQRELQSPLPKSLHQSALHQQQLAKVKAANNLIFLFYNFSFNFSQDADVHQRPPRKSNLPRSPLRKNQTLNSNAAKVFSKQFNTTINRTAIF